MGSGLKGKIFWRFRELFLLVLIGGIGALSFASVSMAAAYRAGEDPRLAIRAGLVPAAMIALIFLGLHAALSLRKVRAEQVLLPTTMLIFVLGAAMIWRLRGAEGLTQQVTRGLLPGAVLGGALIVWPVLVETTRRYAAWVGLAGLGLLFLTGVVGVQDATGARLSLKLGPLPAVQTSELIKLALIIFLAWYIEREGGAAEGRAHLFGRFRLPALRYILPALLFTGAATLALVAMSDFGAVLILAALFVGMLMIGFETRTFLSIAGLGLALTALLGLLLTRFSHVPGTILYRYLAFLNPWSQQLMPNGYTIAEGPGYQIQQAVYAIIAGGVTGTGLGLGSPTFVPLAQSDFILAAIMEEMGSAIGLALLALYAVLVLRIFRTLLLLPAGQVFERLLLAGVGVHLFMQVFIMAGGTLNAFPLTGVTLPFLSLGGVSLMVNLVEVCLALALIQRAAYGTARDSAGTPVHEPLGDTVHPAARPARGQAAAR